MKLNKNLMLLISLVMMSLNAFSQTDIDSQQIQLTKPIARLVIKDLIQFDGLSQEMQSMQQVLNETNNKLLVQGELVANLKTQVKNYQEIVDKKDLQIQTSKDLSTELQKELKKQATLKKTFQFGTVIVGAAAILLAL